RLTIKNRIAMAPMGLLGLVESDGRISQRGIDYYVERARGEVGLIITGFLVPTLEIEFRGIEERGRSLFRADSRQVIPRLRELAEAVHVYGAKIAVQLSAGFGRVVLPKFVPQPVAPSVVPNVWDLRVMTRELTTEEVERLIRSMVNAAEILSEAGIDAVELHGHEGYLMDQFMTSLWNKRTDKYGGNLEGRLRFVLEIIEGIKGKAGADFPVIFRYAIDHYIEGGRDVEESLEIAQHLEKAGVDALHVDAGCYDNWYWPHPPNYLPPGCMVDMAEAVKKVVKIPVITVGRLGYPELAESVIREGKADFVALGRPLLADPEWMLKAKEGRLDDIRPCIGDHDGCMGRAGRQMVRMRGLYISCTVNPACGNERELMIKPAEKPKSVLVVGGGVAGMEAARVAALRGHQVTLYEKNDRLGGHLIAASVPEFKQDLKWLMDYYQIQLRKLSVRIDLRKEVTPKLIEEMKPDVVVIATGSTPIVPEIPGIEKGKVVTAIDLLLGRKDAGETVIVVGGGLVGCETAVYLGQKGKRVTVVEMLDTIIPDVFEANRQYLLKMLAENGVCVLTDSNLGRVTDEGAVIVNKRRRYQADLKADTVVLAVGLKPEESLARALEGKMSEIQCIGDCQEPRKIMDAVWGAYHVARVI
ncbi:FAD-dependent oxidoreductase, partial [Chloroflexota bacterium]